MTWSKPLYKKWTNPVYCRLWLQVKSPGEKTVTVVLVMTVYKSVENTVTWWISVDPQSFFPHEIWRLLNLDFIDRKKWNMVIRLTNKSLVQWMCCWRCLMSQQCGHFGVNFFLFKSPFEVYFKQNLLIVKTVFWFTLMALLWPWWCETAVQMCDQMQQDGQTYLFIDMLLQHVWLLVVSRTSNWC